MLRILILGAFCGFVGYRDDLAEVLAKLTDEQRNAVCRDLASQVKIGASQVRFLLTATPAQISLAVWRAVCQK